MRQPKRYYSTSASVSAIRFDGHNHAEMIEFGTEPQGSRPRVWQDGLLESCGDADFSRLYRPV